MKKKIALLLAVAMLFSVLPMNVFGAEASYKTPSVATVFAKGSPSSSTEVTFTMVLTADDYKSFVDVSSSAGLSPTALVSLTSSSDDRKAEWGGTFLASTINGAGYELTRNSAQSAYLTLTPGYFDTVSSTVSVSFTVRHNPGEYGESSNIKIQGTGVYASQFKELNYEVARTESEPGFAAAGGSKVLGHDVFPIEDLYVKENRAGSFKASTSYRVILEVDSRYHWRLGNGSVAGNSGYLKFSTAPSMTLTSSRIQTITFTVAAGGDTSKLLADSIKVSGLQIVADDDAPRTGDINVKVTLQELNNTGDVVSTKIDASSIAVATRAQQALTYKAETNAPELYSGMTGQVSAWVSLTENAPGSWATSEVNDTLFSAPEGIIITKVEYYRTTDNLTEVTKDSAGDPMPKSNQFSATGNVRDNGVLVKDDSVSMRFLKKNQDKVANIYARFTFDIEAGYVEKYGNEIEITVSGRAIYSTSINDTSVVVATVVDPISVQVIDEFTVESDYVYLVNETVDIVLTEEIVASLRYGNTITLFAGQRSNESLSLDVKASDVKTDSDSGLRVTSKNVNGLIVLTVVTESYKGEVGTITLSNVGVSGIVLGGSYDLGVVVAGNGWSLRFDDASITAPLFSTASVSGKAPEDSEGPEEPTPADNNPNIFETTTFTQTGTYYTNKNGEAMTGVIRLYQVPGKDSSTTYIMASALCDFLGLDYKFLGNGVSQFSGYNADGDYVIIELENGSDTMRVSFNNGPFSNYAVTASAGNVPAYIWNDRFYVPIKAFENVLGITVQWNAADSSVTVNP